MQRGDAVLSTDPNSVIFKLLNSLGQTYSHSGMAMSDRAIRHNTGYQDAIDTVDTGLLPQRLKGTGNFSLRDAWPGVVDQTVEAATSTMEFIIPNGYVLHSSPFDPMAALWAREGQRRAAADLMTRFRGWYSFFSYTNIHWADPFRTTAGDGNMCSGSIFHANRLANNIGWVNENVRHYPADVRQNAANLLFREIQSKVRAAPNWLGDVAFGINDFFGGTSLNTFAQRVANQFVNCMAFEDCNNTTARWQNGVGTGSSLSPDDLLNVAFWYTYVSAINGQDLGFVYNAARPIEVTGNYYCCADPVDPQSNAGFRMSCSGG